MKQKLLIAILLILQYELETNLQSNLINLFVSVTMVYVFTFFLFRDCKASFFWVIFVSVISVLSEFMAAALMNPLQGVSNPANTSGYLILGGIISKLLKTIIFIVVIGFIRRANVPERIKLSKVIIAGLCVLPTLTVAFLIGRYMILINNNEDFNFIVEIFYLLILLFANLFVLFMFIVLQDNLGKKLELEELNNAIVADKLYYENLEKSQTQIRIVKHDMKNLLLGIKADVKNGRINEALATVDRYSDQIDKSLLVNYSSNSAINLILNEKIKLAKQHKVDIDLEVFIPKQLQMDNGVFSVVFGNLFDNAIEAVKEVTRDRRVISIRITYYDQRLLLVIKNPVNQSSFDESFLSTKDDPENHGYGLKSIYDLIEKVDGLIDRMVTDGVVEFTVVLWDK
jgi:sensor histidine kinase YesM